MQPRILINPGDSSFTFYGPNNRSFVLAPFSMARSERRGEVFAVIDTTTKPENRRWADERVARRILKVAAPVDLALVKAANVMVLRDDSSGPLSTSAPVASPYAGTPLLRANFPDLVPDAKSAVTEPAGAAGGGAAAAVPPPRADVPAPGSHATPGTAEIPSQPATTITSEATAKDRRNFYAWRNQAYRRTPINELTVGDRIKIREHSGEYVKDAQGHDEFTVVKGPYTKDSVLTVDTEPYVRPERERRAEGPTSAPPIPATRKPERRSRSRARA